MTRTTMTDEYVADTLEVARAAAVQAIDEWDRIGWQAVSISASRTEDGHRVVTVVYRKGADE